MYSSSSSSSSSSVVLLLLAFLTHGCRCDWDEWWTYDGISGSAYWGVVNPGWSLCSRGRSQSPVDVDPRRLVFDRTLGPLSVGKRPVAGVVANTGQSLTFRVTEDGSAAEDEGRPQLAGAVIAGGPLAYRYGTRRVFYLPSGSVKVRVKKMLILVLVLYRMVRYNA